MSKNLFKLILIGSSNVGKTSIIKQLTSQEFNDNFISTIGVHFYTKNLIIDDKKIEFLIFDTAGIEKFKSITKNYYKNCNVCIIVFDVTDKQSFEDVFEWFKFYKENCSNENNKIFLFGNKIDKKFELLLMRKKLMIFVKDIKEINKSEKISMEERRNNAEKAIYMLMDMFGLDEPEENEEKEE